MKLQELVTQAGIAGQVNSELLADPEITGLALDSREVNPGFLFAALPGVQTHGINFINSAIDRGAVAILSDQPVTNIPETVPVICVPDPQKTLARFASLMFPGSPANLVAVTGTNGKSSTVEFLRQIWQINGIKAACIGTLGVTTQNALQPFGYTTPDSILLHKCLQKLALDGIDNCALEASSHGLVQRRLDGAVFSAGGFTNLSQDHFDYHRDFADYFAAKQRLFLELLPEGSAVVINVDDKYGLQMAEASEAANLDVWRIGWRGDQLKFLEIHPSAHGQRLNLQVLGEKTSIFLPLVGEFQAANALMAMGLAMRTGISKQQALTGISKLRGVRGRLELAATTRSGVMILVDFAHSPDGLEKLLRSVRPHTKGKIILVFGCGGDRDPAKRPLMGKIADKFADEIIVTDDNPRSERPEHIRATVLAAVARAREIADRRLAIKEAIKQSSEGDLIVIAGKGHEQGQIVGDNVLEFDDAKISRQLVKELE